MVEKVFGLCESRHAMSVEDFIFPDGFFSDGKIIFDFQAMDAQIHACLKVAKKVTLYATGLGTALCAVIAYCARNHLPLTVLHYDRESGSYVPQNMETDTDMNLLVEGGWSCVEQLPMWDSAAEDATTMKKDYRLDDGPFLCRTRTIPAPKRSIDADVNCLLAFLCGIPTNTKWMC